MPAVLRLTLETLDCRDGRFAIRDFWPANNFSFAIVDGQLQLESIGSAMQASLQGIEAAVGDSGQVAYTPDTLLHESWSPGPHPASGNASWSAISANVRLNGDALGAITILREGVDRFRQQEKVLLSLVAGQIGFSLETWRLREALKSAEQRMQELQQDNHDLAAILVHDLQGPLGNVLTSLEMVQESAAKQNDPAHALMIDIAVRSSQQLQTLVESILDISRLEAGQRPEDLKHVAVSDLLDYVVEVESPVLDQRHVTLVRQFSPGLPLVVANTEMIQRVLLNLLDNALKVSKRDQTVTVRASHVPGDKFVGICVSDQGPGVPETHHERIFEKYGRVENATSSSKGLGLGLAFCKLAVEAHGGRIWVENAADEGARFCLTLPAAA